MTPHITLLHSERLDTVQKNKNMIFLGAMFSKVGIKILFAKT